ncbi:hypothetical protein GCM10009821_20150 [Aeromicrobium halocynthiae]|uniref:Uncharacterized protein n=1 Tax=Aeromicrobium halocynthiae TaxID=560557 RepID=A0ABP5HKJ8_9ACTN
MSSVRSEKYVIRPFNGLDAAENVLEDLVLRIDDLEHEPGSIVVDAPTLASAKMALRLPSGSDLGDAVDSTPLGSADCGLVVVARALSNRWSHVVLRDYVRHLDLDGDFEIDRDADRLVFADAGGFVITVAIVLLHELQPEPLRPNSPGTWLARRDFRVVPERAEFSFSPDELTDELRKQFSLPSNAPSFVHVDIDQMIGADDVSEAVSVYLDSSILRLLQQSQTDPLALQIQSELAVTTMAAVARGGLAAMAESLDYEPGAPDVEDYPAIASFYAQLTRRLGRQSMSALLDLIRDPDAFAAHLRAAFDVKKHTLAALKSTPAGASAEEELT